MNTKEIKSDYSIKIAITIWFTMKIHILNVYFFLVGYLLMTFWQITAATCYVIKISKKADKLQILLRSSIVDHWGYFQTAPNCLNFLWCTLISPLIYLRLSLIASFNQTARLWKVISCLFGVNKSRALLNIFHTIKYAITV